jgi:hypothetical protein
MLSGKYLRDKMDNLGYFNEARDILINTDYLVLLFAAGLVAG